MKNFLHHISQKKLGIDQETVRTKVKAMRIRIEVRKVMKEQIIVAPNFNIKGIYLGTSEPSSVINISTKTVIHKGRILKNRKYANCHWCNNPFPQYIDKGPRTQLYCNSSCKNKAKDYRRMMKGQKVSLPRIKAMETELKEAWKDNYNTARQKILSVIPIINNTVSPTLRGETLSNHQKPQTINSQ